VRINGVEIEDTYAEAFHMTAARLIITAFNPRWAQIAAQSTIGFATSIIGCGCEGGIESELDPSETPDGRPGVSLLLMTRTREDMEKQLPMRVGQGVMTCATTACFNGLTSPETVTVGGNLRFFGDGWQISKVITEPTCADKDGRRFWRIPVMEGEFLVEDRFGIQRAVAGGNLLILGRSADQTLAAAEAAVAAIRSIRRVALPFPGGIARSGSKVGSHYKFLRASTNEAYCPSLRPLVASSVPEGVNSVLEIVIIGLDEGAIRDAMKVGAEAACLPGIVRISAGNYGGRLGKVHIHLRELWS